jgi:hypothetical protein
MLGVVIGVRSAWEIRAGVSTPLAPWPLDAGGVTTDAESDAT